MDIRQIFGLMALGSAVLLWGGMFAYLLLPRVKSHLDSLTNQAKRTPVRTCLSVLAIGIAIAYGGSKPQPGVVEPAFSYEVNGETVTLLTVTNTPTVRDLKIPEILLDKPVTALAADFCKGVVATNFTSVSIPASITSIGDGFFGPDGSGRKYLTSITVDKKNAYCAVTTDGVLYELASGKVLYAIGDISDVRFAVKYARPSGWSGAGYTTNKLYGAALLLEGALFTCDERVQTGWTTNSALPDIVYEFGAEYTANASVTLYPAWTNKTQKLTGKVVFDPMGGSGEFGPCYFPVGESKRLPKCTLTKDGYVFAGWAQRPNGKKEYADEHSLVFGSATTNVFYAVWLRPDSYGIAFDPGVDTLDWTMDYQSVGIGTVANITPCAFKVPDKIFVGWHMTWNGSAECNGPRCDDGILIFNLTPATNSTVVLKALWEDSPSK